MKPTKYYWVKGKSQTHIPRTRLALLARQCLCPLDHYPKKEGEEGGENQKDGQGEGSYMLKGTECGLCAELESGE